MNLVDITKKNIEKKINIIEIKMMIEVVSEIETIIIKGVGV